MSSLVAAHRRGVGSVVRRRQVSRDRQRDTTRQCELADRPGRREKMTEGRVQKFLLNRLVD